MVPIDVPALAPYTSLHLHSPHPPSDALLDNHPSPQSGYNQLLELGMHSQNIFVQKLNVLNILDRFEVRHYRIFE